MRRRARVLALLFGWSFGGWLLGGWLAAPAAAAELTVYSAGAVEAGLGPLMEVFRRESGHSVRLTVAVPNLLRQRVEAGEIPDVLIAPTAPRWWRM
jgi:ABC-type molybdate transport system substrate-binding protein